MDKTGLLNVTYVLRVNGLDNELKTAPVTISDFDRLVSEASTVTQNADTGIITMTGDALEIVLDPESLRATVTRIC